MIELFTASKPSNNGSKTTISEFKKKKKLVEITRVKFDRERDKGSSTPYLSQSMESQKNVQ